MHPPDFEHGSATEKTEGFAEHQDNSQPHQPTCGQPNLAHVFQGIYLKSKSKQANLWLTLHERTLAEELLQGSCSHDQPRTPGTHL